MPWADAPKPSRWECHCKPARQWPAALTACPFCKTKRPTGQEVLQEQLDEHGGNP